MKWFRKRRFKDARNGRAADGYSRCGRCDTGWNRVTGHATPYSPSHAMFPLCEDCWAELTPVERLPFYSALLKEWENSEARYHYGGEVPNSIRRERVAWAVLHEEEFTDEWEMRRALIAAVPYEEGPV